MCHMSRFFTRIVASAHRITFVATQVMRYLLTLRMRILKLLLFLPGMRLNSCSGMRIRTGYRDVFRLDREIVLEIRTLEEIIIMSQYISRC